MLLSIQQAETQHNRSKKMQELYLGITIVQLVGQRLKKRKKRKDFFYSN